MVEFRQGRNIIFSRAAITSEQPKYLKFSPSTVRLDSSFCGADLVTLEKCMPIRVVREAEFFAISFYKDSRIAAYFRVGKNILRMVRSGFSVENAADVSVLRDIFDSMLLRKLSMSGTPA